MSVKPLYTVLVFEMGQPTIRITDVIASGVMGEIGYRYFVSKHGVRYEFPASGAQFEIHPQPRGLKLVKDNVISKETARESRNDSIRTE